MVDEVESVVLDELFVEEKEKIQYVSYTVGKTGIVNANVMYSFHINFKDPEFLILKDILEKHSVRLRSTRIEIQREVIFEIENLDYKVNGEIELKGFFGISAMVWALPTSIRGIIRLLDTKREFASTLNCPHYKEAPNQIIGVLTDAYNQQPLNEEIEEYLKSREKLFLEINRIHRSINRFGKEISYSGSISNTAKYTTGITAALAVIRLKRLDIIFNQDRILKKYPDIWL